MMKKIVNLIMILSFTFLTFVPAVKVVNATTLREYKNKVAALEQKKYNNQIMTAAAERKITSKRNAILKADQTIKDNEGKVEDSKELVAESEESIKIKTSEMKDVIRILQYSGTDSTSGSIYLDYLFDSSSISELMERQSVIEQIVTYTQEELDGLHKLIKDNEKLQVQLAKDNVSLENSISDYEKQVIKLQEEINQLAKVGLDYQSEIDAQKGLIKIYEKAGCKDDDDIDDCYYSKINGSGSLSRPLTKGKVTQKWKKGVHAGIDLGGVPSGTSIYAPANGTIVYTKKKWKCGGNIIYMHTKINGKKYTLEFAHLKTIKVNIGDVVKKGQIIATQGGDSSTWYYDKCTTGTHLHYAVSSGYYFTNATWNGFSTFQKNTDVMKDKALTGIKNEYGWKWTTRG